MPQCPDCNSMRMFSEEPEGDGKCAFCHGIGFAELSEMLFESLPDPELSCDACRGSGKCQTCGGVGVVEERQLVA